MLMFFDYVTEFQNFLITVIIASNVLVIGALYFRLSKMMRKLDVNSNLLTVQNVLQFQSGLNDLVDEFQKLKVQVESITKFTQVRDEMNTHRILEKLDETIARLDAVENEVITQQVTRHKLNDILASGVREKLK